MKHLPVSSNTLAVGSLEHRNLRWSSDTNRQSSIPGPDDITRIELENGITVLARANFNSPSVNVSGYLASGGLFDPDDQLGLSDFTAAALMRGTSQRDFQAIYDALESVGASLGFNGATHTTGYGGKALSEDLPLLMELLAETLREPAFPGQQVMRLRAQLLTSLAIRDQNTRARPRRPGVFPPETLRAARHGDCHHRSGGSSSRGRLCARSPWRLA
jgi:hypothetical protein